MASASDRKAQLVEAVSKALNGNRSLERILGEEIESVEVERISNLVIQVKVEWDRKTMPRYYHVKVAEPW